MGLRSMTSYRVVSPDNSHHSDQESGNGPESSMREQDKLLPIANVGRIMKRAIPVNGKISKEAKETVQECVSEFISFITGEASEKCQREKRKTVNGDDLLWAMGTLGFEEYMEPLKLYLHRYREMEGEKSSMARQCEEESNINTAGGYQGNNSGSASAAQLYVHPLNPMLYSQHQLDPPYQIPMPTNGGLIGGGAAEYSGTRLATYK